LEFEHGRINSGRGTITLLRRDVTASGAPHRLVCIETGNWKMETGKGTKGEGENKTAYRGGGLV